MAYLCHLYVVDVFRAVSVSNVLSLCPYKNMSKFIWVYFPLLMQKIQLLVTLLVPSRNSRITYYRKRLCCLLKEFLKSFLILCCKPASSNKVECHLKPRAQVNNLPMFISFSTLPIPRSPQFPEHHYKPTPTISFRVRRTERKEACKCVCTSN